LVFWMKNTKIPLSIAFLDAAGVINEIKDMKPEVETSIPSQNVAKYALEVNLGWFERNNIGQGDKIEGLPRHNKSKIGINIRNQENETKKLTMKLENILSDLISAEIKSSLS